MTVCIDGVSGTIICLPSLEPVNHANQMRCPISIEIHGGQCGSTPPELAQLNRGQILELFRCAMLPGYSEHSAFTRVFKEWSEGRRMRPGN
ncbi:hypothetical protein SAMN03159391_03315 [Pseudomonas sp. NFACC37-1]|nr:hypothetical protein SAMN03159391_03315 [Pseudomonas sp. NFACC37-1]SFO81825.1 hypothetical protein SAMN03159304_05177 [Pseudomonas sp. NFACC24-1]